MAGSSGGGENRLHVVFVFYMKFNSFIQFIRLCKFLKANSADPDETPHHAAVGKSECPEERLLHDVVTIYQTHMHRERGLYPGRRYEKLILSSPRLPERSASSCIESPRLFSTDIMRVSLSSCRSSVINVQLTLIS
ncbi:hypothetical protein DPMN_023836 [Dreissena polymorpha]|uniref:Uncharacterized protein n=1 Tax=Dreissena polymorpha TaxID=45954 RepID=A0A9D4RBR6_DREPO|nr:hypothetical protein DPMN_023836 [Dreissena polymorpha]